MNNSKGRSRARALALLLTLSTAIGGWGCYWAYSYWVDEPPPDDSGLTLDPVAVVADEENGYAILRDLLKPLLNSNERARLATLLKSAQQQSAAEVVSELELYVARREHLYDGIAQASTLHLTLSTQFELAPLTDTGYFEAENICPAVLELAGDMLAVRTQLRRSKQQFSHMAADQLRQLGLAAGIAVAARRLDQWQIAITLFRSALRDIRSSLSARQFDRQVLSKLRGALARAQLPVTGYVQAQQHHYWQLVADLSRVNQPPFHELVEDFKPHRTHRLLFDFWRGYIGCALDSFPAFSSSLAKLRRRYLAEDSWFNGNRGGILWLNNVLPTGDRARSFFEAKSDLMLTQLLLTLEAYRAEHQEYPESLQQLVPEYLTRLPADPFDAVGSTFEYQRQSPLNATLRRQGTESPRFPLETHMDGH